MRSNPYDEDRVLCRTPSPGTTATRIPRWKYDAVRQAIRAAMSSNGDTMMFRDLPGEVARALSGEERERLGSVSWYTTVVKLDLEARGELLRVPGAKPQRLRQV